MDRDGEHHSQGRSSIQKELGHVHARPKMQSALVPGGICKVATRGSEGNHSHAAKPSFSFMSVPFEPDFKSCVCHMEVSHAKAPSRGNHSKVLSWGPGGTHLFVLPSLTPWHTWPGTPRLERGLGAVAAVSLEECWGDGGFRSNAPVLSAPAQGNRAMLHAVPDESSPGQDPCLPDCASARPCRLL